MYVQVPGAIYNFYFSENTQPSLFYFSLGPIRDRNNKNNNKTENSTFEYIPQAIPAGCTPENVTVPLNQSSDPNVFIWPNCIRIERCGGCCNHDLLQCQPREIEMKKFKVTQTTLQGAT